MQPRATNVSQGGTAQIQQVNAQSQLLQQQQQQQLAMANN